MKTEAFSCQSLLGSQGETSERISQCFTFCDFLMSVVQCKRVAISLEKKNRFLKEALLKTSQGTAGKPSKSIHVVMLRPNESRLLPCFSNKKTSGRSFSETLAFREDMARDFKPTGIAIAELQPTKPWPICKSLWFISGPRGTQCLQVFEGDSRVVWWLRSVIETRRYSRLFFKSSAVIGHNPFKSFFLGILLMEILHMKNKYISYCWWFRNPAPVEVGSFYRVLPSSKRCSYRISTTHWKHLWNTEVGTNGNFIGGLTAMLLHGLGAGEAPRSVIPWCLFWWQ